MRSVFKVEYNWFCFNNAQNSLSVSLKMHHLVIKFKCTPSSEKIPDKKLIWQYIFTKLLKYFEKTFGTLFQNSVSKHLVLQNGSNEGNFFKMSWWDNL